MFIVPHSNLNKTICYIEDKMTPNDSVCFIPNSWNHILAIPFAYDFALKMFIKDKTHPTLNKLPK